MYLNFVLFILLFFRVVLPNGSLLFKRVLHSRTERPDEGLYQCTAFLQEIGTIVSKEAKLQIACKLNLASYEFFFKEILSNRPSV